MMMCHFFFKDLARGSGEGSYYPYGAGAQIRVLWIIPAVYTWFGM